MASVGTKLFTLLFGKEVGVDAFGNRYFFGRQGRAFGLAKRERRWVEYNGLAEPSKIPPGWHAWLHYLSNEVPASGELEKIHDWERDHVPNLTGTINAYKPTGHLDKGGVREVATGDYIAWKP